MAVLLKLVKYGREVNKRTSGQANVGIFGWACTFWTFEVRATLLGFRSCLLPSIKTLL